MSSFKKYRPSMAALIMASFALPGAALAQPASSEDEPAAAVDEIVVTGYRVEATAGGTRVVTPLQDLPMSVQVVNEDLIRDLGARRIEDAIRFVSGITVVNRNEGRTERFAIRGFNSGTVTRNGVPFNVQTDAVSIQQIDVVKGANSILYGANDPGGLINYVSKTPLDYAAYSVAQTVGSRDLSRTEFDLTGPLGERIGYRLTGAYTHAGSHLEHGLEEKFAINPVVQLNLADRTSLILDYSHSRTRGRFQRDAYPMVRDASGAYIGYADAGSKFSTIFPDDRNLHEASSLEARLTHAFNDNLSLRIVGARTRTESEEFNMIGFTMPAGETRMLEQRSLLSLGESESRFVFAELSARFSTPWMTHKLVGGGEYRRLGMGRSFGATGTFSPAIDILDPPTDPAVRYVRRESFSQLAANPSWVEGAPSETHAFFVTDQITLADGRTHILAGLRYDKLRDVDNFTPQLGVSYALNDNLSIYGLYSESFRLNGTITLQSGEVLVFDPEVGVSYEGGLKFNLFSRHLSGSVAMFELTRENVLQTTASNDPLRPIISLSGEERSRGVEIDVSGRVTSRLQVFGSYAHTDAEVVSNLDPAIVGLPLEGVSPNAFSLFARYDFGTVGIGDLSVNAGLSWRDGPIHQYNTLTYRAMVEDGYTVVDAGVDYALANDLTLSLKVRNLFDEVYMDRRAAYAAPRAVNFTIRKSF